MSVNKAKELKILTFVKNAVEAKIPAETIKLSLKKSHNLSDFDLDTMWKRPKMQEELAKLEETKTFSELISSNETAACSEQQELPLVTANVAVSYNYCYYREHLGLTDDIMDNVKIITRFYQDRIGTNESEEKIKETMYEYIKVFNLRGLDGAEIVADRISMVSRKAEPRKHALNYLVGCLRNAMNFGLASSAPQLDNLIIEMFEDNFGFQLSEKGRNTILGFVSMYGIGNVLSMLRKKYDTEMLVLSGLETLLREKDEY